MPITTFSGAITGSLQNTAVGQEMIVAGQGSTLIINNPVTIPNAPLIVGADPGGTEPLRINGGARITGALSVGGIALVTSTTVIGVDPGGSDLFRVGGNGRFSGTVSADSLTITNNASVGTTLNVVGVLQSNGVNAISRVGAENFVWSGTTSLNVTNAAGTVNIARFLNGGSVIIGNDPNPGGELLRVGGSARFGGSVTANSSLVALVNVIAGPNGNGRINLTQSGNTINTGYVEFIRPDGSRTGYIGFGGLAGGADTGEIVYVAGTHNFSQGSVVIGPDPLGTANLRVGGTMRINGAGNVIDAEHGTATQTQIRVSNSNGRFAGGVLASGVAYAGSVTAGADFQLWAANASRVVVTAAGALIVGTNPGGSELLRVGGMVRAGDGFIVSEPANNVGLQIQKEADASRAWQRWRQGGAWWQAGFRNAPYSWVLEYQLNGGIPSNDSGWTRTITANTNGTVAIGNDPGGDDVLRIGGNARINGGVLRVGGGANPSSLGAAVVVQGGANSTASGMEMWSGGAQRGYIYTNNSFLEIAALGGQQVFVSTTSTINLLGGATIVGTDPSVGGPEILRVGGNVLVNGNIASSNTARAGTGSNGWVSINAGGSTTSGFVQFMRPDGSRVGYIGFAGTGGGSDSGTIPYVAGTHQFTGRVNIVGTNGSFEARTNTTALEAHIRPLSGRTGWLSFTEDSVADRWVIGIRPSDSRLYFSSGNASANTNLFVLEQNGTAVSVSGFRTVRHVQTNSGTFTLNFTDGNGGNKRVTLNGAANITLAGGENGATYVVELLQDGTGGRTVGWSSNVRWQNGVAPVLTTTANRKDVFVFYFTGTHYLGAIAGFNYDSTD